MRNMYCIDSAAFREMLSSSTDLLRAFNRLNPDQSLLIQKELVCFIASASAALQSASTISAAPELLAFSKWARDQFLGDSGTGFMHWEQHPEFMAGIKAIEAATLSERTEEAKGRPDARDQLRAERLATA